MQALHYHPHMKEQYMANTMQLRPLAAQFDFHNQNADDVRRQFYLANQYGSGQLPGY